VWEGNSRKSGLQSGVLGGKKKRQQTQVRSRGVEKEAILGGGPKTIHPTEKLEPAPGETSTRAPGGKLQDAWQEGEEKKSRLGFKDALTGGTYIHNRDDKPRLQHREAPTPH